MTSASLPAEFPVPQGFYELTIDNLAPVLQKTPDVVSRLGGTPQDWRITEVSDGNMNAVFRVDGPGTCVIAKQALPYIRVIGKSWPFPVDRIDYEHQALETHGRIAKGYLPEVYAYLPELGLVLMETLSPHIIARKAFIAGQRLPRLAEHLGDYLARTLFFTSDFALTTPEKKALEARFCGNAILCETTEDVIFAGPYWNAPLNRITPGNESIAASFRADTALKLAATEMGHTFRTRAEALIHGDLHTGSLMVTEAETKVIDPEWAFYGPMGFDIGALLGNMLLAYFSQPGHASSDDDRKAYADWLLETMAATWTCFAARFRALADAEVSTLPMPNLFERETADEFIQLQLARMFTDAIGFAGAKMIRRIIGISHVEDFEAIADVPLRAACEFRALTAARLLLLKRRTLTKPADVVDLVRDVQAAP